MTENQNPTSVLQAAWDTFVAGRFTAGAFAKWPTPTYALVRGDRGDGRCRTALVTVDGVPMNGTWLAVCWHGTEKFVKKGGAAHLLGLSRRDWCEACAADLPGTIPGLGAPEAPAPIVEPAVVKPKVRVKK